MIEQENSSTIWSCLSLMEMLEKISGWKWSWKTVDDKTDSRLNPTD